MLVKKEGNESIVIVELELNGLEVRVRCGCSEEAA